MALGCQCLTEKSGLGLLRTQEASHLGSLHIYSQILSVGQLIVGTVGCQVPQVLRALEVLKQVQRLVASAQAKFLFMVWVIVVDGTLT